MRGSFSVCLASSMARGEGVTVAKIHRPLGFGNDLLCENKNIVILKFDFIFL
ncbi:MAG: hypothetical protein U0X92_03725 [Anaerolineales bacterium]